MGGAKNHSDAKPEHHGDHHHEHHDTNTRYKGTPLDFSHKHPIFDINLDKRGP